VLSSSRSEPGLSTAQRPTRAPPRRACPQVVDAGAVPLLVLCVQEPELALKRVAASALSDVAKHTPELAQARERGHAFCGGRWRMGEGRAGQVEGA
jgi:hypothetical protein